MHITKWGEYGILCSLHIAKRAHGGTEIVGASEIASAHDIALDYAQQILQRLRKGNIIESVRGSKGGYRLAKSAEAITLLDIMKASEGDSFEVICESKPLAIADRCVRAGGCALRPIWREMREQVDSVLTKYDLAMLSEIECNGVAQDLVQHIGA